MFWRRLKKMTVATKMIIKSMAMTKTIVPRLLLAKRNPAMQLARPKLMVAGPRTR